MRDRTDRCLFWYERGWVFVPGRGVRRRPAGEPRPRRGGRRRRVRVAFACCVCDIAGNRAAALGRGSVVRIGPDRNRHRAPRAWNSGGEERSGAGAVSSEGSIFSIVLATGADNVAVYAPIFAIASIANAVLISAAYLLLWIAGCIALLFVTPDISRVHALKRLLEPALAIYFIAVGVAIVLGRGAFL